MTISAPYFHRMHAAGCLRLASSAMLWIAIAGAGQAMAMTELEEKDLGGVTGEGIVFALDDFSFRMAPTSYIELIGSTPVGSAATYGWDRGDARYYGLSFSYGGACNVGTGPGTGTPCAGGANSLGQGWYDGSASTVTSGSELAYPIGQKATTPAGQNPYGIVGFASVYNPFILRVFQYAGYNYAGTYLNQASGANAMPTVLEFIGPSKTDPWRWSFWGEMVMNGATSATPMGSGCNVGGNSTYCGMQSQTIIHGTPTASGQQWTGTGYSAAPSQRTPTILRMMQTPDSTVGAPAGAATLGLNYQSAISGDFRFSIQQTAASPDILHRVPQFNTAEGLYFKNVDAFLPLGYLHSQALMANGSSTYNTSGGVTTTFQQNGNFVLELARIPNVANVYNNIYCGQTTGVVCINRTGGTGASGSPYTYGVTAYDANQDGYIDTPNPNTHGYVRWGNWTTTAGGTTQINTAGATGTGAFQLPTATSTTNGIYFSDGAGTVTNLGISRIEGMLIQHLRISTLGAGL